MASIDFESEYIEDETPHSDYSSGMPTTYSGKHFVRGTMSVSDLVKAGMTTLDEEERTGRIYASQAAVCSRQAVLSSTNKDPKINTPANNAYYALGNTIEDLVMTALVRQRVLLYPQYRLPDVGLDMGGYIDGIVYSENVIRVLEVKSCGELPTKPKLEHRAQALVYSAITGLPPTILYFSRKVAGYDGNLYLREFSLNPTNEDLRRIVYTIAYTRGAIERGIIPEMPDEFTSEGKCGFCRWKEICWHGKPLPRPVVTTEQHLEIVNEAAEVVNKLMDLEEVRKRRNGVLKYVKQYGTSDAKTILAGDWSLRLEEIPS